MKDLYRAADSPPSTIMSEPKWIEVQRAAFSDSSYADEMIQLMAQATVQIPIVRKAIVTHKYSFKTANLGTVEVKKGETVILDLVSFPNQQPLNFRLISPQTKAIAEVEATSDKEKVDFLTSQLNIADKYGVFVPRRFGSLSLTSMVKFIAQMKNPRRGHDAQGRLKKIHLDSTPEGYANYMAPMRVSWIKEQVKLLKEKEAQKIFTDEILRPEADTYLTPTWDEFVPFPMTWKIRFDGFGVSDYSADNHPYGRVKTMPTLPDFCPPWYQPQGPSTVGGSFATVVCVCANAGAVARLSTETAGKEKEIAHERHCPCLGDTKKEIEVGAKTAQLSTGCGLS